MSKTLFTNARLLLDGHRELQRPSNVLVNGNLIEAISRTPLTLDEAKVIDVGGRTLMPGLIDAHAHITGLSLTPKNRSYAESEIAVASAN